MMNTIIDDLVNKPHSGESHYTAKDFKPDVDVRWCAGCGAISVLSPAQRLMPELGIPKEKIVFISGIGCSGRFPYYMDTYGFHGIHGRALPPKKKIILMPAISLRRIIPMPLLPLPLCNWASMCILKNH